MAHDGPVLAGTTARAPERSVARRGFCWKLALWCFSGAILLLVATMLWTSFVHEVPPSIVPPAGEVLEGTVPFRFGVISDTRGNQTVFEEALRRIKGEDVCLILHAGDIVKRVKPRYFDWVLHELDEEGLTVPFCPVPGNHELDDHAAIGTDQLKLYKRSFGPRRYWFSYANVLFVAFDDSTERCLPEDLEWLEATLDRLRGQYDLCFVYMHVPPRDPRPGKQYALKLAGADKLMAVLKKHDVTAVFAGHLHAYGEDKLEGIPIYITGGAGERKEADEPHHYLICTVGADGSYEVARRDMAHLPNEDYAEYVLRAKFPHSALLLASCGLVLTGLVFVLRGWTGLSEPA